MKSLIRQSKNIIVLSFPLLGFIWVNIFGQITEKKTLLTVGEVPVSGQEFERLYLKNRNSANEQESLSIDEYLELYINFKLKVVEAEELGYDTLSKFKKELNGYRSQLAKPYLTDKATIDLLVMDAYERMLTDVNASHILIKTLSDASPEDTLKAYKKTRKITDRLLMGESFEIVARGTSDDPSVKSNGGNLGYFTVFQMVYPFESAAYSTPVGKLAFPVRTRFGYHIIKVNDKRKAIGSIKVAHIMVAVPMRSSDPIKAYAKEKIYMIYEKILNGEDFNSVSQEFSDDYSSARNGGVLPWFGTGRMVPEFENAAFSLQNDGDISEPVRTGFGWHIIKRLEKKEIGSFDEMKAEIKKKIYSGYRADIAKQAFIENLKKECYYELDSLAILPFYLSIDETSLQNGSWQKKVSTNPEKTLFSFAGRNYSVNDFVSYLNNHQKSWNFKTSQDYIDKSLYDYVSQELLEFEKSRLEIKHPEFKYLMKEYHDGMLLFEISDKKVWSKAVEDSAGLENYYVKNRNNYMGAEGLRVISFTLNNPLQIKNVKKAIRKSKKKKNMENYFMTIFPSDSVTSPVTISYEVFEKGDDSLIDSLVWKKGYTKTYTEKGETILLLVSDVIKAHPKNLEEIQGLVTSDYQNFLEKEWLKDLKEKYSVNINEKTLSELKQKNE